MAAPGTIRPLVRWYGGKALMSHWIIANLPPHRVYVEPFGGSAAVLLRKPRSEVEVLNDLDAELANLYRVARDPVLCGQLGMLCALTPYSAAEFRLACKPLAEDRLVERARRLLVRHYMGRASDAKWPASRTGFRSYSGDARSVPARDWFTYSDGIGQIGARLRDVVVECGDAVDVMRRHDRPDALHYVDPPYMPETRKAPDSGYRHELDEAGHVRLLDCVLTLKGSVVVSGYAHPVYDYLLTGWRRVTREVRDQAGGAREEVLWVSPRATAATRQPDLFTAA
ncbi:DNA adenine methylase [Methylobacterium oryzae]|uniref:DNA adenine methylase n=1 Tax=Methylobacterium oryzae TaxID=334852 RepID=UPI002F3334E9